MENLLSDMDILIYTLKDLLESYRPCQTTIRTHAKYAPAIVEELHSLLSAEELSLGEKSNPTQFSTTTFVAHHKGSNKQNNGHHPFNNLQQERSNH